MEDENGVNMLSEFEIGRYRGLESLKLKDLKRVNVLAGPNNCGKTSILEAIILSGLFNDTNDVELLLDALSSRYYKFSPEFFDSMFAIGCEPVISLKSKFDSDIRNLHTQITYDKSQIIEKDTSDGIRNIFQLDFEYFYSGEETVHDRYRMNFEDLGNHYNVKIRHGQNNKLKLQVPCKYISSSRFDRTERFLKDVDMVLNQNLRQELIEILQIFDEQIINFEIVGSKRVIKLFKESRQPLTLYDYGNGMYKAFYIAVAALLAKDGILLVDEVETGIHNKALEHFISKLLSVCEKNNVQLFLTTHSLETIDVLLEDCRDTLDDVAFYHIRNSEEQSVTKRYSGKKLLDLRTEIGFDIR